MDPKICLASLRKLAKMIPRFAPSFDDQELAEGWAQAFADLPPEAFAQACRRAVSELDAFPSIRELRALCGHAPIQKPDLFAIAARDACNAMMGDRDALGNPLAAEVFRREGGSSIVSSWREGFLKEKDLIHFRRRCEVSAREIWREAETGTLKNAAEILALSEAPATRPPMLPAAPEAPVEMPIDMPRDGQRFATLEDLERVMQIAKGEIKP
jgi:hypothetical protein